MGPYIVIFGCLCLSAFFSAAETAITSLGILKSKHLLDSGGKSVSHVNFWLSYPGRVLTTILFFNTGVNILASSVVTEIASARFQSGAVGIATGVTTFLVLVFGEVIPKSFAKAYFEKLAVPFLRVVIVIYYATYPVIWLLSGFADLVIRIASKGRKHTPLITEEELEFIVNEGQRAGVIGDLKKNIIEGAFDFDETKVREIMTPRTDIKAFAIDTPIDIMMAKAVDTGYSRFPVYRNHMDHMVGMVLVKDLISQRISPKQGVVTAKDIMREGLFAPESKSIMEVFKDLKRTKSHMAIIIDEYGGTAGIVTMEDILEEIVGEIQDETDVEEAKILQINEKTFDVSGSLNLDDFFKFFRLSEEEILERDQDVDTIAGWVTQVIGQIPKVGQNVRMGALSLEVLEVKHRRIHLLRVQATEKENILED